MSQWMCHLQRHNNLHSMRWKIFHNSHIYMWYLPIGMPNLLICSCDWLHLPDLPRWLLCGSNNESVCDLRIALLKLHRYNIMHYLRWHIFSKWNLMYSLWNRLQKLCQPYNMLPLLRYLFYVIRCLLPMHCQL